MAIPCVPDGRAGRHTRKRCCDTLTKGLFARQEMNQHGVARMCRLLAVLQPSLSALGAPGGVFRPEAARAFDKARRPPGASACIRHLGKPNELWDTLNILRV